MSAVSTALKLSWLALAQPKILARLLIPIVVAFVMAVIFVVVAWLTVPSLIDASWLAQIQMLAWVVKFYETTFGQVFFSVVFAIFLAVLFLATLYLFTILFTSLLVVPLLSSVVHKIYFPEIQKNNELSFAGSLWNTVKSVFVFLTVFALCSPLLLIPGMQIILPLALNAFLVRRLLPYDTLQDFASKAEYVRITKSFKGDLWKLSLVTGAYLFIPVVNILAPSLMALTFLFFGFEKLKALRQSS
jgi:hypothetical protein